MLSDVIIVILLIRWSQSMMRCMLSVLGQRARQRPSERTSRGTASLQKKLLSCVTTIQDFRTRLDENAPGNADVRKHGDPRCPRLNHPSRRTTNCTRVRCSIFATHCTANFCWWSHDVLMPLWRARSNFSVLQEPPISTRELFLDLLFFSRAGDRLTRQLTNTGGPPRDAKPLAKCSRTQSGKGCRRCRGPVRANARPWLQTVRAC